jgi:hypothetical protein
MTISLVLYISLFFAREKAIILKVQSLQNDPEQTRNYNKVPQIPMSKTSTMPPVARRRRRRIS